MAGIVNQISRSAALRREFLAKKRQLGLLKTVQLAVNKVFRKLRVATNGPEPLDQFDLNYGTDTSSIVEVGALDMPDERMQHAVRYQTAITGVFESMVEQLPIDFSKFVFVDIGSGKGRVMLLASNYPFQAIRGVELSRHLHDVAQKNIGIYKDPKQRCHDIASVCADATAFELSAEPTVFYLFNPFDNVVMRPFVKNLERSLERFPRPIFVLYLKPVCRDVFDTSPYLKVTHQTDRYIIYQSNCTPPSDT